MSFDLSVPQHQTVGFPLLIRNLSSQVSLEAFGVTLSKLDSNSEAFIAARQSRAVKDAGEHWHEGDGGA